MAEASSFQSYHFANPEPVTRPALQKNSYIHRKKKAIHIVKLWTWKNTDINTRQSGKIDLMYRMSVVFQFRSSPPEVYQKTGNV